MESGMETAAVAVMALCGGMETVYGIWAWTGTEKRFHQVWKDKRLVPAVLCWLAFLMVSWFLQPMPGQTPWPGSFPPPGSITPVRVAALFLTLILLAAVDVKQRIVPDRILGLCLVGQLILGAAEEEIVLLGRFLMEGAVFAGILLAVSRLLKGGMGLGDVKLLGVIAMTAGWKYAFLLLAVGLSLSFVAGICLLLFRRASVTSELPFVPFLAAAMIILLLAL